MWSFYFDAIPIRRSSAFNLPRKRDPASAKRPTVVKAPFHSQVLTLFRIRKSRDQRLRPKPIAPERESHLYIPISAYGDTPAAGHKVCRTNRLNGISDVSKRKTI